MLRLMFTLVMGAFMLGTVLLDSRPSAAAPALTARSSNAAGVNVVVTPKALAPGVPVWEFEIVLDTHTKPLNDNLAQAAVLVDDAGRRFAPTGWQGDPPGGHHRKGLLRFSAPVEMPSAVQLEIAGVGGAGTRSFRWDLK